MPDLEISRLPQLAGADVQGTDPIAVADLSASETKKLTVSDLLTNGVQFIGDNAISSDQIISLDGSKIDAGTITSTQLGPDSVTDVELADLAVDTAALQDLAVTNGKVASGLDGAKLQALSVTDAQILSLDGSKIDADSVGANAIGPAAVGNSELGDDAISTLKIQDGAVTSSKIAGDIDGSKLVAGSITTGKYALGSVDETILADGSITNAKVVGDINGAKLLDGSISSEKLGANSVTASAIADGAISSSKITGDIDGSKIVDGSISTDQYAPESVDETILADGSVTNNKIAGDIDGSKIAAGSIDSPKLGANSVTTSAITDGAVTDAKIAGNISGTRLVDGSITAAKYAPGSVGETIIVDGSITDAKIAGDISGAKLLDGSISSEKLGANSVTTTAVADGAITNAKLAGNISGTRLIDGSITSSKYGAGSVDDTALANGAVTDSKIIGPVNGSKLDAATVTANKLGTVTDRGLDQSTGSIGIANTVTAGTQSGITWNAQGLITSANPVNPSDLPVATDSSVGGVSVPTSGGLAVTGLGALSIANDVTADTVRGIEYNEHGCIVSIDPTVDPASVPIATQTTVGGVKVPGPEIGISADGSLTFADSGVTPGVYPKITVNAKGVVTLGTSLAASDIPSIEASKVSTGEFPTARIGDKSITLPKLADYSISFIQEAVPPITSSLHIGCLWLQESTAGLYMWNGNAWTAISIGRLSQENLRYCGTIDATDGLLTGITSFGTSAGYSIGDPLATPSDTLTGTYFVVDEPGNGISELPGVSFDNGDWVLCNGAAAGYVRIDTLSSGGGGGGGSTTLNGLLDVSISSPSTSQLLQYGADALWHNITLQASDVGALSPGDDISELNNDAGFITADSDITGNAASASNASALNNQPGSYYLDYVNFTNTPTIPSTPGEVGAATSAQGAKADSAIQPGENVSELVNDANYAQTGQVQTFSATQTFTPQTIHNGGVKLDGPYEQIAEAVSALEIDLSSGNYFTKMVNGNSTFTFVNPPSDGTVGSFTIQLTLTSGAITWPSSVEFSSGTAPTLATGKTHLILFTTSSGGLQYRAAALVDYSN